jgi:hypothetical protein
MAPRITHAKISLNPAGADPNRVYGPDWNADHVIQGMTIGTDVQAHSPNLDSLSSLGGSTGLIVETAANTFAKRTLAGTTNRVNVTNADGAAGNPAIDIAPTYAGQGTITTVGTITSGAWNGSVVTETFGGTNQSSYVLGDLLYASAPNSLARLSGNASSAKKFLVQTGTGSASAAPAWGSVVAADVPASALTGVNDTNVTLTLGGTPAAVLLAPASITMGWSGTLAAGRLNANVVQGVTSDTNITGAIAAQNLTLGWSGSLSGARGGTGVNNGANTVTVGGNFSTAGAAALPAIAQGDVWYGSAAGTISALVKSTTATRYLANTGPSNNPNWDQVNLANGVTGALALANGGTAQTTAAAARASSGLNVESFTGHGDSAYTILPTDKVVGTNATFTASRTWTLPAANAVNAGQPLVVADFQGTLTGTNTLVISRAGSDTINGGTSVTINSANGAYILWPDGSSKWTAQAIGAGAASGVSSFNGRAGAVSPAHGDYSISGNTIDLPQSFLAGMQLSNDGTTPNSVLDISAGQARDSTNATNIVVGAFTKSTGGSWVAGSGGNGMGNGLTIANSTWYHVFAIINAGAVDVYFDTDAGAANKPASTGAFRRIGSFKTDGSAHIIKFTQIGNEFVWSVPVGDVSAQAISTTSTNFTLGSVPTGINVVARGNATSSSGNVGLVYSAFLATQASNTPAGNGNLVGQNVQLSIVTDTSARISVVGGSSCNFWWTTTGWHDFRGQQT